VWTIVWQWQERLHAIAAEPEPAGGESNSKARGLRRKTHQTIARVTSDFETLDLNTNVAALMELSNALGEFNAAETSAPADVFAVREAIEALVVMLAPLAPHAAEELWEALGHEQGLLQSAAWPKADADLARKEELEIPVQVNGKLRSRITATPGIADDDLRAAALADEKVRSFTEGHEIVKVIVIPERLVNVVVK
jgi:leucyl-tRNA synthetase